MTESLCKARNLIAQIYLIQLNETKIDKSWKNIECLRNLIYCLHGLLVLEEQFEQCLSELQMV